MKVYGLIGRSGTGKSFQAVNLCKELNIESIIDDGLFICRNKVAAGISAKRQKTKVGAVKAALFTDEGHMKEVSEAIGKMNPSSVLVIGTSDRMVDKIVARLGLEKIDERIYLDDITTEVQRAMARKQRDEMGQHVIPVPTFQLKRQFSGYFMMPMRMILKEFGSWRDISEKSVVRPTYSYLGQYKISERVMNDIIEGVKRADENVAEINKVGVAVMQDGINLYVTAVFRYGIDLPEAAKRFQKNTVREIEYMTAFNVNRLDLEVKGLI